MIGYLCLVSIVSYGGFLPASSGFQPASIPAISTLSKSMISPLHRKERHDRTTMKTTLRSGATQLWLSQNKKNNKNKNNDENIPNMEFTSNTMNAQEISNQMREIYLMDYDWKKSCPSTDPLKKKKKQAKKSVEKKDNVINTIPTPTMYSALCIVPPDEVWDIIQRARHLARDHTLYRWPPAIRLFHPFAPRPYLASAASAIGEFIEKHQMEPFEITFDNLVIRPHWEAVEEIIALERISGDSSSSKDNVKDSEDSQMLAIQKLIAQEEKKGRDQYNKRMKRKREQQQQQQQQQQNSGNINIEEEEKEAHDGRTDKGWQVGGKQRKQKNDLSENMIRQLEAATNAGSNKDYEYNGPCVICLEPSDRSKRKLQKMRHMLKKELFAPYDSFSVSSSLSNSHKLPNFAALQMDEKKALFKPTITLGTFPTTDAAVQTARKLQSLWEPLTFNVTDLQLISRNEMNEQDTNHIKELNSVTTAQYECDAMIMFMGEEVEADEDSSEALLSLLFQAGEEGGGAASLEYKDVPLEEKRWREERKAMLQSMLGADDEDEDEDEDDFNEFWFDDEDDEDWDDEGATIVIGRTQFFLGEMRLYVGMPASNPIDSKDRVLGQGVSAVARRRGAIHRKGERWNEGDYGTKERDHRP